MSDNVHRNVVGLLYTENDIVRPLQINISLRRSFLYSENSMCGNV